MFDFVLPMSHQTFRSLKSTLRFCQWSQKDLTLEVKSSFCDNEVLNFHTPGPFLANSVIGTKQSQHHDQSMGNM